MNKKDAIKWLKYRERGVTPSRVRTRSLVYSDNGIRSQTSFSLTGYEVSLTPISDEDRHGDHIEGLMPAFTCEVVADYKYHNGGNHFDIRECLERILPVVGFRFRLPISYSQWEEYEGEWMETVAGGGAATFQRLHTELPGEDVTQLLDAYESLSRRSDKRSRKALSMRIKLKEALELEEISTRHSFLVYYNILELVSDDLASKKSVPSGDEIALDVARFSLSTKGSQRTKLYFLFHALENDYDIDKCIGLADARNEIAHGALDVDHFQHKLCKDLAYWASGRFAFLVAASA